MSGSKFGIHFWKVLGIQEGDADDSGFSFVTNIGVGEKDTGNGHERLFCREWPWEGV